MQDAAGWDCCRSNERNERFGVVGKSDDVGGGEGDDWLGGDSSRAAGRVGEGDRRISLSSASGRCSVRETGAGSSSSIPSESRWPRLRALQTGVVSVRGS